MENELLKTLDKMYENGDLKQLVNGGLISSSLIMWRNLMHAYLFALERTNSKMQSMNDVAQNFGVSVETVRAVRKKFNC